MISGGASGRVCVLCMVRLKEQKQLIGSKHLWQICTKMPVTCTHNPWPATTMIQHRTHKDTPFSCFHCCCFISVFERCARGKSGCVLLICTGTSRGGAILVMGPLDQTSEKVRSGRGGTSWCFAVERGMHNKLNRHKPGQARPGQSMQMHCNLLFLADLNRIFL